MRANRQEARRAVREHAAGADLRRLARETEGLPENAIEIIRERLSQAARLIERTSGRTAPKEFGNAWPPVLREFADLLAQEEQQEGERDRDHNRIVLQPSARQVTMAEDALTWRRYVVEAQALAALNIWLRCRALRIRSWQREAVRRGFARETAKRRLARAYFLIAVGLVRDRKPIEDANR
jgi:hypothetical protein